MAKVPSFDTWMNMMYPGTPKTVKLISKWGDVTYYPNVVYNEKRDEYEKNLKVFAPAIQKNMRLYKISEMQNKGFREDLNTVDYMSHRYINNALDKNRILKEEIQNLRSLNQTMETSINCFKMLEL
tara:strand:+ start:391 stop:768 length:378 start_codon:yes stop_codon:yes gene_type:complete